MSAETRQNGADNAGDVADDDDVERDDDDEDDGEETTRLDRQTVSYIWLS